MGCVQKLVVVFGLLLWIILLSMADRRLITGDSNCSIVEREGEYYADCSNKNLRNEPHFSDSVYPMVGIDLSVNLLTKFPLHLPQTLKYLNLSANSLDRLMKHDIRNYPNLIELRMSKCNLKVLESHSLNGSQLRYLDVSGNRELTLSVLRNISCDLMNSPIETLILDELQCKIGPSIVLRVDNVECLQNTILKTLSLASNRICYLDNHVIPTLPESLTVLNISDNRLTTGFYIFQLDKLKSMKILDFSHQSRISEAYVTDLSCSGEEENYVTEKTEQKKDERQLKIYDLHAINMTVILPLPLEKLYIHDCYFKFKLNQHINIESGKHLLHVAIQNNVLYEWNVPLHGIQSVRHLDMSNNFCTKVLHNFFEEGKNLIFLDLSHNILGDSFAEDINGNIFRPMRRLKVLDISRNKITILPYKMFQSMASIRKLIVSKNHITKFEVLIQHMKHLSLLDLSHNQIKTLPQGVRKDLNEIADKHSIRVNLYKNPLSCRCEHLDFIMWLHKHHNKIVFPNFENYTCFFQNERHFLNITTLLKFQMQCAPYSFLTVILFAVILIFTIGVICKIVYRFRWRLRYLYYITAKQSKVQTTDSKPFRYDAFISYAAENEVFANDIINDLEKKHHLRLCFHSRDFIPGTAIADNISNAIQNSRRTVCIVTSQFLQSYWCMFEFNMARMVSFYSRAGENILILVLLDKCPMNMMPLDFLDVIRSYSYLEYPKDSVARKLFTLQLAKHL